MLGKLVTHFKNEAIELNLVSYFKIPSTPPPVCLSAEWPRIYFYSFCLAFCHDIVINRILSDQAILRDPENPQLLMWLPLT